MQVYSEILNPLCQNCFHWKKDKYDIDVCEITKTPCGNFFTCQNHGYIPGMALKRLTREFELKISAVNRKQK